MDNELHNGKKQMDKMHKDRPPIQERVSRSSPFFGSVSKFSIEEINYYLEGLIVTPDGDINQMLNAAISLLEDREDGIEAVLERRRQNATGLKWR